MAESEFTPNPRVRDAYVEWIRQERFDPRHEREWRKLFRANPEAAMCEAEFWRILTDCGVSVEPNADLDGKRRTPDFRCQKRNNLFYIEVTCIRRDTATRQIGLESELSPQDGGAHFGLLNNAIMRECAEKTPQCADLDAPCIVAVGTFHGQASELCLQEEFAGELLTGETRIGMQFDPKEARCVGEPYPVTRFDNAAFNKVAGNQTVELARLPISALLLGGFGCNPPRLLGISHPEPRREFDTTLLDPIRFCRQEFDPAGRIVVAVWS